MTEQDDCVNIQQERDEMIAFKNSKKMSLRFEIKSPYTTSVLSDPNNERKTNPKFTQQQLDMRRKVEILKYSKQSFTSGNFSNRQNFSRLMRSNKNVKTNIVCRNDELLPSLSTSCDVPGPPIILQLDPSVPLYNYESGRNIFSLSNDTSDFTYDFNADVNVPVNDTTYTTFMNLYINNIESDFSDFTVVIPVGINIVGDISNNNVSINDISSNTLTIDSLDLRVLYHDTQMDAITINSNVEDQIVKSFVFNIDSNATSNETFKISQYLYNIVITNLRLPTQRGFVYKFQARGSMAIANNSSTYTNTEVNLEDNSSIIFNINASTSSENIDNSSILLDSLAPPATLGIFSLTKTTL